MPLKGYTWPEEYYKKFYESEKVQAHLEKFVTLASQNKPNSQRIKMAQAKVGRKYTEQHKTNMSEAQKFRQALKKDIVAANPDLPSEQVWAMVREQCEALK